MSLVKRDEHNKVVNPFEMIERLNKLSMGLKCEPELVVKKVIGGARQLVTSELIAETAASMAADHPHYDLLAAKIVVSELHKNTKKSFSETIKYMYGQKDPLVTADVYDIVMKHDKRLDNEIEHGRDSEYDYIGLKILERSYLLKIEGKVVERPQYMLMRVAIGIHKDDIESAIMTYKMTSQRWFAHASPTLLNAGTPKPQLLSSCFLVCMEESSIKGFYDTLKKCAVISESAGSLGLSVHNIQSVGSDIHGRNAASSHIIPTLRVINDTACFVDEEGGRIKGAIAVYLEPWNIDIYEYLNMRKNNGKEEQRVRDLLYGLWVPDLFMERVEKKEKWSLFGPREAPNLADCYGEDFEKLYTQYEGEGKAKKHINANELWTEILKSQIETGTPYILFKDSCNRKSNQNHNGTIKSSSLSAEIVEYSSLTETAMCSQASIALPLCVRLKRTSTKSQPSKFVGSLDSAEREFDFEKLAEITSAVTRNLNKIIDVQDYPLETARFSNLKHRPIGIGVQGLADTFVLLGMAYDSAQAQELNKHIFETIYYYAMKTSCDLTVNGGCYDAYPNSLVSKGCLQQDMWEKPTTQKYDWENLRNMIKYKGIRNSLLVALMPTGVTSEILGHNECFEPYTSYIYNRRVSRMDLCVVNKHLVHDLIQKDLWSPALKNLILCGKGSVQKIPGISDELKAVYKTVWDIDQEILVDMAAERGCYIDQSQSLSIYMKNPDIVKLGSLHLHAWKKGLKTGMYHLRSQANELWR